MSVQIYPTDHSATSSSPCTPVNSPPPLTSSGQGWGGSSGGVTPFTPANHPPSSPGFGDRALHMVCPSYCPCPSSTAFSLFSQCVVSNFACKPDVCSVLLYF